MRVSRTDSLHCALRRVVCCVWCGFAVLAKIFRNQSSDPGTDRCDTGGCVVGAARRRSAFRSARRFPAIVAPCARILCGAGSRDGRRLAVGRWFLAVAIGGLGSSRGTGADDVDCRRIVGQRGAASVGGEAVRIWLDSRFGVGDFRAAVRCRRPDHNPHRPYVACIWLNAALLVAAAGATALVPEGAAQSTSPGGASRWPARFTGLLASRGFEP